MTKPTNPALFVVAALGGYLLLTSAFFPIDSLSVFDAKRILQLALFAGVLIFSVAWAPLRTATVAQLARIQLPVGIMLAAFFMIGITSSLRLEHPAYALVDVSMMFVMLVMITVIAGSSELSDGHFDKWAVVLLALTGLAVAVQELMGFVANWMLESEFSYTQALVHFAHPRFYNQLQTWSIPVLAALPLLFPGKRWIKWGCIVLLGLQWFLVVAYAARGTAVSLIIAMIFIALWCPRQRRTWLKYQLAGVLTGVIIYLGILQLNGLLIPQSGSGEFYAHSAGRPMLHTTGRTLLWRLAIEDAVEHPLLGAGPTRYACDYEYWRPAHPHSFPLRIMGEWGFVAALLVFMLVAITGLSLLRNLRKQPQGSNADPPLKTILAISLTAGAIHACVSGIFIMPASQVAMIIIAGWMLGLSKQHPWPAKNRITPFLTLFVGVMVSGAQFTFVATESPMLVKQINYFTKSNALTPRLWQDGRVCDYLYETKKPEM